MSDGISYRKDFDLWWPDYDHKPEKCFSFVKEGLGAIKTAMPLVDSRAICIQAGGHAGMWPMVLADYFQKVWTFEPEPALFSCMVKNLARVCNVIMADKALGPEVHPVKLKSHCSAGSWRVSDQGDHEVEQITIDSLNLASCGAIFLDVEHYEIPALRGATETISKFQPIILLECLIGDENPQNDFMSSIGYDLKARYGRDRIYGPA